jgi:hypothetical protein
MQELAPPPTRVGGAARETRHPALVEVAVAALLFSILTALVYGPHTFNGGFLSDAWGIRAAYEFAPNRGLIGGTELFLEAANVVPRPLQAVYWSAQNALFGSQMTLWLIWQVALSAVMSTSLYVLLRQLGFRRVDAGAMSALVLIFPAATSIRLWIAPLSALTISLALIGFVLALHAFRAGGRRRLVLHGASVALFVASLLVYELVLPIMLASVLVYRLRVPWRDAVRRWLVDCAILVPLVLTVTRSDASSWEVQSGPAMWDHFVVIWEQARTLFATVVLPFDVGEWLALALVVLVPAVALAIVKRLDASDPARAELRRWSATVVGGVAVVAFGYAIYVPAMDYYAPLGQGIANRVNAVPSVGWVLIVYGLLMLVGTLALHRVAHAARAATALTLAACAVVSVGWLQTVDRDSDAFVKAYEEGRRTLQTVNAALPDPPRSSIIWTFGQPVEIAPGVPVFGNTWDMTGSVRLLYDDPSLRSYVAFPGTTFECRARLVVPGGRYADEPGAAEDAYWSPYGRTYFVDTTSGRLERIRSRGQCERAVAEFPLAPALPG